MRAASIVNKLLDGLDDPDLLRKMAALERRHGLTLETAHFHGEALDDVENIDPESYLDRLRHPDDICYSAWDGREYYPVTYDGKITRQGSTAFSNQWKVYGMSFHHWSTRFQPWDALRIRLDREGALTGYLWDYDHGTTRRWGRRVTMNKR